MKLGLHQSLRPDLQLRLSPQILQRIEVLQLASLDLAQMIEQELQQNEALEREVDVEPEPATDAENDEIDERLDAYESDDEWKPTRNDEGSSSTEVLEATAEARVTLHDHLREQLDELELNERERALARAVIQALNDRGWLSVDLDDLDVPLDPPSTPEEREHALHVVQGLEPAGIACRDMVECLLLQIEPSQPKYDLLATLVIQHLDDIAHNRIPRIVRDTGAAVDDVMAAIDFISHLDPVPGRRYSGTQVPHVRPDVVVRRHGDDFEISLENDWIPDLTVSRSYLQMARDRTLDPELRKHLRGKIESARSLIDAVEQRKHTLFRVASELVNRQLDFIEHGKARLRPLRMQEVADALGVHVSTVSRAISGKFMQTPRGIVPLRDLFTGEIPVRPGGGEPDAEAESRASVQERIRKIVAAEDPRQPLSDEAIVQILKDEHDLDIARRTVTKYRKALSIGSSRDRRKYGAD